MYYAGIDYHKRYSFVSIQDDKGAMVLERQVPYNNPLMFEEIFRQIGGEATVVYECGLNWTWLYGVLEKIVAVKRIVLANAYKVRLIAEAQIKTDKLDARKLAMLLRLGVIPSCHIPNRETRKRKEVLRQRAYWVRRRTGLRNRVHRVIERQHGLAMPQVSDLFGMQLFRLSPESPREPVSRVLWQPAGPSRCVPGPKKVQKGYGILRAHHIIFRSS